MPKRGETDETVRLFAEKTSDGAIELGLAFDGTTDDDVVVAAEGVKGFTFAKDSSCEARLITE